MSKHSGDSGRGGHLPWPVVREDKKFKKKNAYDKKPCLKQVIMSNIILNYL